ncbi:hypothetical protein K438DRAFT_1775745 [Mycena galopus ATCC 62051]|nr:hypothetical protein K438DRAFT_1775745 [Mycena galopus ATCC 62051]
MQGKPKKLWEGGRWQRCVSAADNTAERSTTLVEPTADTAPEDKPKEGCWRRCAVCARRTTEGAAVVTHFVSAAYNVEGSTTLAEPSCRCCASPKNCWRVLAAMRCVGAADNGGGGSGDALCERDIRRRGQHDPGRALMSMLRKPKKEGCWQRTTEEVAVAMRFVSVAYNVEGSMALVEPSRRCRASSKICWRAVAAMRCVRAADGGGAAGGDALCERDKRRNRTQHNPRRWRKFHIGLTSPGKNPDCRQGGNKASAPAAIGQQRVRGKGYAQFEPKSEVFVVDRAQAAADAGDGGGTAADGVPFDISVEGDGDARDRYAEYEYEGRNGEPSSSTHTESIGQEDGQDVVVRQRSAIQYDKGAVASKTAGRTAQARDRPRPAAGRRWPRSGSSVRGLYMGVEDHRLSHTGGRGSASWASNFCCGASSYSRSRIATVLSSCIGVASPAASLQFLSSSSRLAPVQAVPHALDVAEQIFARLLPEIVLLHALRPPLVQQRAHLPRLICFRRMQRDRAGLEDLKPQILIPYPEASCVGIPCRQHPASRVWEQEDLILAGTSPLSGKYTVAPSSALIASTRIESARLHRVRVASSGSSSTFPRPPNYAMTQRFSNATQRAVGLSSPMWWSKKNGAARVQREDVTADPPSKCAVVSAGPYSKKVPVEAQVGESATTRARRGRTHTRACTHLPPVRLTRELEPASHIRPAHAVPLPVSSLSHSATHDSHHPSPRRTTGGRCSEFRLREVQPRRPSGTYSRKVCVEVQVARLTRLPHIPPARTVPIPGRTHLALARTRSPSPLVTAHSGRTSHRIRRIPSSGGAVAAKRRRLHHDRRGRLEVVLEQRVGDKQRRRLEYANDVEITAGAWPGQYDRWRMEVCCGGGAVAAAGTRHPRDASGGGAARWTEGEDRRLRFLAVITLKRQ